MDDDNKLDDVDVEGQGASTWSWRRLIKAGAATAGIVWAAPVVDSFMSRAAAQSVFTVCNNQFSCGMPDGTCGPNLACFCLPTTENTLFCGANFDCGAVPTCSTSSDCPSGWACQGTGGATGTGCCGAGVCIPPCGSTAGPRTSSSSYRHYAYAMNGG